MTPRPRISASAASRAPSSSSAAARSKAPAVRGRPRRGQGLERRIAQRDGERQVARPEGRRVRHQRLARGPVDHVGEQHRQRALPVVRGQVAERRRIVGFDQPALRVGQAVEHRPERAAAARRRRRSAAPCRRRPSGRRCRRAPPRPARAAGRRTITASSRAHALHLGREQPAGVDHDQHLLPPLVLVLPRDRLAAAGGRLPVDDPGVVARHPLAEPLEQPAFARPADRAEPGLAPAEHLERQRAERRRRARSGRPWPARAADTVSCRHARPSGPEHPDGERAARPRRRGARARAPPARRAPRPAAPRAARVGVSAPPSGSGSRSRTTRRSGAAAAVAPAVAHHGRAPDGERGRRLAGDLERARRRGAARRRAGTPPATAGRAPAAAPAAPGHDQRQRRHERQRRRAHQPPARRDHDHRGASIFSMIPRSAVSGGDPLELELGRHRRPGAAAPPARAPSRRPARRTPARRAAPPPGPS